jgi:translation elongation factor P/translation initiation factor 5A
VRAGVISSNDFKVGSTIEIDNAPWRVIGEAEGERGKGARRGEE